MEILIIIITLLAAALISIPVKKKNIIETISVISTSVALYETVVIALKVAKTQIYSPFQFFSVDSLGAIIMLIIGFVGFIATIYSVQYLRQETKKNVIGFTRVKQYFVLLNIFLAAMFLAISANSPIFAWIAIEATTLSTAFLISFYNKPSSIEGAWKYLVINSVGLLLGFFGTLLYFASVASLEHNGFVSWQTIIDNTSNLDPLIAKIAFVFVLIGYGTKVGLAPMHTWLPDAHSKASAPISALLSGVLLNVAMVVVLRFKVVTDAVVGPTFSQNLLIGIGLLSIIIAALIILTQKNYKRLLAYSSIENMSLVSLGFGFGGIGIMAAILHMIYHSLTKSALFLSAGTIFLKYGSTKIKNVCGAITALPVTSVLFLIGFFIIVGTPPFGMFSTKISILSSGITAHPVISMFVLIFVAILFVGFFKHSMKMFFGKKPEGIEFGEDSIWLIIPPLVLIATVCILSFYLPPFLQTLINNAVAQY